MQPTLPTNTPSADLKVEADYADVLAGIDRLRHRNDSWLSSLGLSPGEREQLALFEAKQLEALENTLDGRNAAIKALAESQGKLVEQVTEVLLQKTLTTVRADVAHHITEEALRLRNSIDANSKAFYMSVARNLDDARMFPEPICRHMEAEALASLERWSTMVATMQEDFTNLITLKNQ